MTDDKKAPIAEARGNLFAACWKLAFPSPTSEDVHNALDRLDEYLELRFAQRETRDAPTLAWQSAGTPLVGPHASRERGPKATEEANVRGHKRDGVCVTHQWEDGLGGNVRCSACELVVSGARALNTRAALEERIAQLEGMHRIERGCWAAAANLLGLGTEYQPEAIHAAVEALAARSAHNRHLYERTQHDRDDIFRHGTSLRGEILSACRADGDIADPLVEVRRVVAERDVGVGRIAFLEQSIRHVQDREEALHAQVKRQASTIDTMRAERDRVLADAARLQSVMADTEDCPRGHPGATRAPEQETGAVERCLRCAACPAFYVRINGRWLDASSPRIRPPLSCGDCGKVAFDIEEHHTHTCPPGTKKGPL